MLRGVTVATAVGMGGTGLLIPALPFWAELLGAGRAGAGYLWAALEAGAIAGALAAARPTRWPPQRSCWPASACSVCRGRLAAGPVVPGRRGPGGAGRPGRGAGVRGHLRDPPALVAEALRGQIFTTAASLKLGAFAVGSALTGPVVAEAGVAGALVAVGAPQLLAVALGHAAGARGAAQGLS